MITMYRGKWKFSVMSADEAEDFIRQPHSERIRFISITEANGYHIDFQKCEGNIINQIGMSEQESMVNAELPTS